MLEKNISEYDFFKKLCKLPFIDGVYLYGSRARQQHQERSDIDLAINCPTATKDDWLLILDIFEETDTLLKIDSVRLDELSDDDLLKQNILKEKVILYEKPQMTASVIEQNFTALGNALERLKEAVEETPDEKRFIIDSTIHRFEFSFELFWKNFKNLAEQQGKEALSPRQAISAAYMLKWFDD
jgi:predicted nucleotidyltransferase